MSFSFLSLKSFGHFKGKLMPKLWTPRVIQNFLLLKVSTNFVCKEQTKFKLTKATGLDYLTARLLKIKDGAPVTVK